MAVTKGTNSYLTLEEANAYFEGKLDNSMWANANPTRKEQALITATRVLDERSWIGTAISTTQKLAFPRVLEYFDTKLGRLVFEDGSAIPNRIENATAELAYHLLNNENLLDESSSVSSISVAGIGLSGIREVAKIPSVVADLIRPLQANGTYAWWRAN